MSNCGSGKYQTQIAKLLAGTSTTSFPYCAIGSSTTAPSAGQHTLVAETDRAAPYRYTNGAETFNADTFFPST